SLANAGYCLTYLPSTKNVAGTRCLSRRDNNLDVTRGFGPSSNVRAHAAPASHIVDPNNCDLGCSAAHAGKPRPPTAGTAMVQGFMTAFYANQENDRTRPVTGKSG